MQSPLINSVRQQLQRWLGRGGEPSQAWKDTQTVEPAARAVGWTRGRPDERTAPDSEPASGQDSQSALDDDAAIAAPLVGAAQTPGAPPDPLADAAAVLPPTIGRYIVKARLGNSPLAPVYEAWDTVSARAVAVVTVPLQLEPVAGALTSAAAPGQTLERLKQEALAQARQAVGLVHPHIATVVDAGWSEHGLYTVSQRLAGRDLRAALAQGWQPRPSAAAQTICRMAQAVAHAHAAGVVHGDIRPAQIFINEQGQPKLLGFGTGRLARRAGLGAGQMAPHDMRYLAPAQLQGGDADVHTDIRALGVVLYELLAQTTAFAGATAEAVTQAVLNNKLQPVRALQKNVSATLAAIASRAMDPQPAQQYESAADMAQALAQWLDRHAARKQRSADAQRNKRQRRRAAYRTRTLVWFAGSVLVTLAGMVLLWQLSPTVRARLAPVDPSAQGQALNPVGPVVAAAPSGAPAASSSASSSAPSAAAPAATGSVQAPEPAAAVAVAASSALPAAPASTVAAATTASAAPALSTPAAAVADPATAREARDARDARDAAYAVKRQGQVMLDISPSAQVVVNGVLVGTAPPMTQLTLPVGQQTITLRSAGFDPYSITVYVRHDQAVELRHLFTR